jgi:hypothetical protein
MGPNIDVFEASTRLTVGYRVRRAAECPKPRERVLAHVCRRIARRRSLRVIVPWSNTRCTTRFTASSAAGPSTTRPRGGTSSVAGGPTPAAGGTLGGHEERNRPVFRGAFNANQRKPQTPDDLLIVGQACDKSSGLLRGGKGAMTMSAGRRQLLSGTRVRFPSGIRAVVGQDLTFEIRGVALRHGAGTESRRPPAFLGIEYASAYSDLSLYELLGIRGAKEGRNLTGACFDRNPLIRTRRCRLAARRASDLRE